MKITILRALNLGDFLTAIPAYRAIRRSFPSAKIVLAAPAQFQALCDLLDGAIDEIAHTVGLEALPLAARDADLGIDLHGCGPASQRLLLQARAAGLIAFRRDEIPETFAGPTFDPSEHEVVRWCRLLQSYGIHADPSDLDLRAPAAPAPERARGATLVHPGAASEARRWPSDRFVEVIRAVRERGENVVITGSDSERDRALEIARRAEIPLDMVFAGQTNLAELASLVASSGRVVCGDTGIAHLATAFRRPSVVLFGPTPPSTWGPPLRPIHRVLWNGTTGDPHADRVDRGLAAIGADRVIAALRELPALA